MIMKARRRLVPTGLTLAALAALGAVLTASPQEGSVTPSVQGTDEHDHAHDHATEGEDVALPPIQVPVPGMSDTQQEMVRLFGRVERNLRKIDMLLSDAGAGDSVALASVGEAGISELLNRSLASGRETLQDIDRILELAAEMSPPPSSCPDCAAGT